jgi:hypothetical protein
VEVLALNPLGLLSLDNDLEFDNLNVQSNYDVILSNIGQIDFLSNPFAVLNAAIMNKITILDSIFEIVYENKTIDATTCNYLAQNEIFISLVETSSSLILENTRFSTNPYCQYFFNSAKLDYFKIENLNSTNKFEFIDASLVTLRDDFESTVSEFVIEKSDFTLNSKLLDKIVFKNIYIFKIANSSLRDIQQDLFKSFAYMKSFDVELNNFEEFIQSSSNNNTWFSYLNINVNVDLKNMTDFNNNKDSKMQLYLTDLKQGYLYPEEDFCLFKNFPHSKLVVPKINTKPDLQCTCTLLWLIQYKSLYQEGALNYLDTPSVSKCLNDPNFEVLVNNCNFANKINDCSFKFPSSTSTTSTTTSTSTTFPLSLSSTIENEFTPSPNNAPLEPWAIALIVLACVILIGSVGAFIYFKRNPRKSKLANWRDKDVGLVEMN